MNSEQFNERLSLKRCGSVLDAIAWELQWRRNRARAHRGAVKRNSHLADGRFVTSVIRLPTPLAARITDLLAPLAEAVPGHHYYPASTLHATVLNLDSATASLSEPFEIERLADWFSESQNVPLEISGFSLSSETIFCQVKNLDGALVSLRRGLRDVAQTPRSRSVLQPVVDRLGFANVVRFGDGPIKPLAEWTAEHRATTVGSFNASELQLVETDKTLSDEETRVIASFPLGPLT